MLIINQDTINTIADMLKSLVKDTIIENRQNATGRTISALRTETSPSHVELFGPKHFGALQYGRRPTIVSSGSGELYPKILEWVRAKGVIFNDGIQNSRYTAEERTAKTITYFIHKRGTYLYQNNETFHGQRNPILRKFTPELMKLIQDKIMGDVSLNIKSEVFPILKNLSS